MKRINAWRLNNTHPKVAGEEFNTSGGTYAAVPTNVQALSSGEEEWHDLTNVYGVSKTIKKQKKTYLLLHLEELLSGYPAWALRYQNQQS